MHAVGVLHELRIIGTTGSWNWSRGIVDNSAILTLMFCGQSEFSPPMSSALY